MLLYFVILQAGNPTLWVWGKQYNTMKNRYFIRNILLLALVVGVSMTAEGQTTCPPVGLPIVENFDTPDSLPTCWERDENFDNAAMKAHIVGTPTYAGSGALMISSGADNDTVHEAYVMARRLSASPAGIRIKMKVRANQAGAVLMVGASETGTYFVQQYGFVAVDTLTIAQANVWIDYEVDFAGYDGDGDRLTFRMRQAMQGGQIGNEIYIDEMVVERCAVQNLWVSHRSSDELTLHWSSYGEGSANLTVTPVGGGGVTTYNGVESPYRITGLTPSTSYVLTLTPQCDGENSDGLPQSTTASTLPGPHEGLVYCESFESGETHAGWMMEDGATITPSRSYTGLTSVYLPGGGAYAVVPQIAHSDGSLAAIDSLMLDMKAYAVGSGCQLVVGMTDYPEEDSTIVAIDTIGVPLGYAWNAVTMRLGTDGHSGRYLILRAAGGSVYIDDLRVGRCLLTGVALAARNATSITIEWDSLYDGGDVTIEPIVGGGTTISVGRDDVSRDGGKWRYTISGLQPGSSHSYAVYGSCDAGHCGAATVATTTYAQDYTLPYCTDFEGSGALPTDWQAVSSHSGRPTTVSSNRNSGSRAMEMNAAGGVSGEHSTVMMPPITLDAGVTVVVSFAAMSQQSGGTIELGTIDESGNESTFSAATSCVPTGQWQRYALSVTGDVGQRLALRYYHSGYGTRTAWVDDLEANLAGVSSIYASGERANGATLNWSGGGDTVDIELRRSGSIWTERHNGATSPLVLDSLDEGVTYHYYVRCRTAAGEGCWMYGGSFTTNSDALRADYCHPTTITLGSTLWTLPFLEEESYAGLRVSLEAMGSGTVQVGLMTDEGAASTFTQIGSGAAGSGSWNRIVVALGGHETAGHYIALRCTGSAQVRKLRIARGDIVATGVVGVGATQATITWSADGAVDSVMLVLSVGGAAVSDSTLPYPAVSSITLENLDAATSYSYALTAINSNSERACSSSDGVFVTLGSDIGDGWCETFEGIAYGALPTGWTVVAGNGSDPATYYYSGSQRLRMTSTAAITAMVAMPEALSPVSGLKLRAQMQTTGSYSNGSMLVAGIMTYATSAATFTPLDTVYPGTSVGTYVLDLSGYNGNGRIIALRYLSPAGSSTLYIDNMGLATAQVSGLLADQVTDRSVRLSWQSAAAVHITGGGIDTVVMNGNTLTVEGLNANSGYTFTAWVLGADSTSACQTVSVSTHTLAEPMVPPLCLSLDDYNSATMLPYGWTRLGGDYPQSYSGTRYEGQRALRFYVAAGNAYAVSPMIESVDLTSLYLSFYLYNTSGSGIMTAGVMTDPTDSATFVPLQSFGYTSGWTRCELSLAGAPQGARYLALRYSVATQWSQTAYVDYLMLVGCPMPTANISNPRTNTLEVHWNYPNGAGDSVVIEWGSHSVHTATSPYIIEGLNSSTTYTVRVRPLCSDDVTCHSVVLSGTTLDEPADIPYCQLFASYSMPSGWYMWSDSGSINLTTVTPDGSRALRMYAYAGAAVTAIMPQISTVGYCDTLDSIYLKLRLSTTGAIAAGTSLEIGMVSDLLQHGSFTPIASLALAGVSSAAWQTVTMGLPPSCLMPGFLALRLVAPAASSSVVTIDNICIDYCYATDIHIIDITPTSATFEWVNHGADRITVYWGNSSYTAYSSPFTIEGFTPNQGYSFSFTAACQCGHNYGYEESIVRRMPAEPMEPPVCYSLDDMAANTFPDNWRRTGGAYSAYPRVASAGGESHAMDMYTTSAAPLTMAMEPLPEASGTVVVSLRAWCSAPDAANAERMVLGVMADAEDGSTFTPLESLVLDATETWQTLHFVVPQQAYRHIAFRFSPASTYHYYLDDISVAACAAGDISFDGQTVSLSLLGAASSGLVVVTDADGVERTVAPVAAGSHTLSSLGLAADSTYTLRAYALCTDTIGCVAESVSVGLRHELPLCEDFSGSTLHPYGWEVTERGGPVYPRIESGRYHLQPGVGHDNTVALPMLPVGHTLGGLHVRLTVTLGSSADIDYTHLELGSLSGGSFSTLTDLTNSGVTQTHYVTLPPSAGQRLAIRARSTSGQRNIYLDDLQITTYPEPSTYTLTQTGYRQQHIYWSADAGAAHYDIEYGPAGFAPGTGVTVASDSCHAVLAPLSASTQYHFYFIDTAGNRYCYPHPFTSMTAPVATPYCRGGTVNLANGQLHILPEADTAVQALTLVLSWNGVAGSALEVGAMSDIADAATFVPIDTLHPAVAGAWQRDSVVLGAYADTGHFVALRFAGGSGTVGQLTLQAVPQPHFHVLSSSTVEVTTTASDVDYYLRFCTAGQSQTAGTLYHITRSPDTITSLAMYTQYSVYTMADAEATCAPPISLRTHLDVEMPYCTDLAGGLTAGWLGMGAYRMMPYPIVDSLARLHLYLSGNGEVTVGATRALDDTATFVPLTTLTLGAADTHIFLAPYAALIGDRHYVALRLAAGATLGALDVQTVARPEYHVLSSSTIEATLAEGLEADYYIEACLAGQPQGTGTVFHATTSPFVLTGLAMFTHYDLYARADSLGVTCADPVTLRTHLDIEPPYCSVEGSDGWYTAGTFHVMPYAVVDTMISLYATFSSRGALILGVQPTLTDTAAFVPLAYFQNSIEEEHIVHLADYAEQVGERHYLAFRYTGRGSEVTMVYLHTCPVPTATLSAFNTVRFDQDSAGIDYWIAYGDTTVHATGNPYYIGNLAQNTVYEFSIRCDSATATCIPPITMLTGVQLELPYCVDLDNHHFTIDNLPAGWFTLDGGEYVVMPIADVDSMAHVFMRLSYRLSQIGTAMTIGVMTDPHDAATYTTLATLSDVGPTLTTLDFSFAEYRDTGLYIAFHAIGSNPQSAVIDRIELQTVPFVEYLLTAWDSVLVVPTLGDSYGRSCYIHYGDTVIAADSLPWGIGGLPADSQLQFSIQATDSVAACSAASLVATTHLTPTPLCDLQATLDASNTIWHGPELAETDIASLMMRMHVDAAASGTRIAVGTLRLRNVDSTFHAVDTLTLTAGGTVSTTFGAYNGQGRFLAIALIEGSATLSDITLDHCLTPQGASVALVRHNIVRLYHGDEPSAGDLWLRYGPTGGAQQTIHIDSLPRDFTLANSTEYTFTLGCDSVGIADNYSCATPLTIATLDTPPALTWCVPFDAVPTGSLPTDWRMATMTNSAQEVAVTNVYSHSTSRSLGMHSTIGHNSVVVLPDLGLDSLRALSLSLWLRTDNAELGVLEVGVIFNTADAETFRPLWRLTCHESGRWERKLIDLSDAPEGAYFLAMRCRGVSGTNNVWVDDLHVAECGANSLEVTQVEANQITLRWRQTGTPTLTLSVIADGGSTTTVDLAEITVQDGNEAAYRYATISGLEPLTNYRFAFNATCGGNGYCTNDYSDTCRVFTPAGGNGCIDPTNLTASYTTCFYGTYNNPVADTASVDLGYASSLSRHTIHYDLDETDPRTGGLLHTVPAGATASVRLGNWSHNAAAPEAEAISYGLSVDTTTFNLLIMRYAAVLQDPNHSRDKQPRFSLELLDATGHVLDSSCGRADFIANYQLGWNMAAGNVLWKDWTTVGVDLTPYAGQTVYVRLTTRDCNEGSHYGYAYFTLECMRRNVTTSSCGVVDNNQFTAPSGFNYYWYTSASADTISTAQTIEVPTDNTLSYLCQMSFVDNPGCYFTMTAYAGTRYPLSLFDYEVSLAPCSFDVVFNNRSTISSDRITPVGTGEGVETAVWILGNGDTISAYNTSATYEEGTYNVSLITGIAGDACLDTLTMPLTLTLPPTEMNIVGPTQRCWNATEDTLWLPNVVQMIDASHTWTHNDSSIVGTHLLHRYYLVVDSASYAAGSYTFSVTALDSVGCTVSLSHPLTVHPTYRQYDTLHLCSLLLPYTWRDTTLTDADLTPPSSTSDHRIQRLTADGCDSVMMLNLTLYNNADFTPRDTAYGSICDNQSFFFSDSLLIPDAMLTHNMGDGSVDYTDSLVSWIGCDSLSTVVLTVHPTFDHHLRDTICSNTLYTWGTPQRTMLAADSVVVHSHGSDTLLAAPSAYPADTAFTDGLLSVYGCDSLSSLHLHLLPAYHLHYYDTICDAHIAAFSDDSLAQWAAHAYRFEQTDFDSSGTFNFPLSTFNFSCDSLRTLHLKVYPTYDQHLYDTIYDGDRYTFEGQTFDTTGIYPQTLEAVYACDSLRTLHLQRNRRIYIDTVLCQNRLPYTWNGAIFADGLGYDNAMGMQVIKDSVHLAGLDGIDSLVVMTVVVRDTSATVDMVHTCDSLIWHHTPDTTYRTTTAEPWRRLTQQTPFDTSGLAFHQRGGDYLPFTVHLAPFAVQCDSVRHLDLTVDYTHWTTDHRIACDSLLWPDAAGALTAPHYYYRDTLGIYGPLGSMSITGPVDTMVTVGGCDSVVALDLNVHYATYHCDIDTFCWNEYYYWRSQTAGDTSAAHWSETDHYYLTETLQTHRFHHRTNPAVSITCDSVRAIQLTQMARPQLRLTDSIDCANLKYIFGIETDMPYTRWTDNHSALRDLNPVVEVSPQTNTVYRAYVDYHAAPLCPLTDSISVRPVVVPDAVLKVNPEALRYDALEFDAYDLSTVAPRSIHPTDADIWIRGWYVNGLLQNETEWHLHHLAAPDRDTLLLALRVYNGQCADTAIRLIPINRVAIFAPNVFTPLRDNNQRFLIVGHGIRQAELFVYNREGLLLYRTTATAADGNIEIGWDGRRSDGTLCEQGGYVWKLVYGTVDGLHSDAQEVGTVLLLK